MNVDIGNREESIILVRRINKMDWIQFSLFFIGVGGLWLWSRTEANADRRDIMNILKEMKEEMKDFHGRLERQDAEFKAGLLLLEEKFRK